MAEYRFVINGRLVFGLIVILFGLALTLDNLEYMEASDVIRWWPLLLAGYGVARLTGMCCGRRHVTSGIVMTVLGSWLLLNTLNLLDPSPWDLWPLVLVFVGFALVTGALGRSSARRSKDDPASKVQAFAFMSGSERKVTSPDFLGGDVTAILGGHTIDLRGARTTGESAVLDFLVWWGGVEIRVPKDWTVVSELTAIMGGVDDKSVPPEGPAAGQLVLRGLVLMGGVEVKN